MISSPSYSSSGSEEENEPRPVKERRVARKSTTSIQQAPKYVTRTRTIASKISSSDRFMENFNPETSVREKRKLSRKINPPTNVRRTPGCLFDENGVHLATGIDLCDCLKENCLGCWFPCPKCGSRKCSIECRVNRKFVFEQLEFHGYDLLIKNPLLKNYN